MKVEQIKTVEDLVVYYLLNESRETLQFFWDFHLGAIYNTDKDFQALIKSGGIRDKDYSKYAFDSMFCDEYHQMYFRLRLLFEIRCHNRFYSTKLLPIEIDDVENFVQEFGLGEYMFLGGETYESEKDLLLYLQRWYSKGLEALGQVKKMSDKGVTKEVWDYYINELDLEFVEEWNNPQEQYEAINIQKELMWLAYRFCTAEYSSHRVWMLKHIHSFKNPTLLTQEKESNPLPVIRSIKWIEHKPIEQALDVLKPLKYLFANGSLDGLKMALGGGNIYDMRGCIEPSRKNKEKLLFLIYNLILVRCVRESENMEETIQVLTNSSVSYRRYKSDFKSEQYSIPYKTSESILALVNAVTS